VEARLLVVLTDDFGLDPGCLKLDKPMPPSVARSSCTAEEADAVHAEAAARLVLEAAELGRETGWHAAARERVATARAEAERVLFDAAIFLTPHSEVRSRSMRATFPRFRGSVIRSRRGAEHGARPRGFSCNVVQRLKDIYEGICNVQSCLA
jgi:hypothetical protein